jgi:4-amino-4-deoxy-L-arabinose transferase-like glycosyltransferase
MRKERSSIVQSAHLSSHTRSLLIIMGLGILVRLIVAWVSVPTLIEKTIPDDSFYYFSIARHLALDGSISVNGITTTNGFHPLWLLLISPFYFLLHQDLDLPIHLALTLGGMLDTVTVFLAYRFVRLLTSNSFAALASAAAYALNPRAVFHAANGLETALSVCMVALFLYGYARIRAQGGSLRRYLFLGATGGLLLLCRTDNAFLFSAVLLHATWKAFQKGELKRLFASQILTASLMAPWLVWNYCTFGTIVQTSAIAFPFVVQELNPLGPSNSPITTFLLSLRGLLNTGQWLIDGSWTGLPPLVGLPLWIAAGFASVKTWSAVKRRGDDEEGLILVGLAVLACALLLLFHVTIRRVARSWYFAPQAWVFAALVGMLIHYSRTTPHGILWKYRRHAVLAIGEIFVLVGVFWWTRGLYGSQVEMYQAAIWLRANTPPDARIGTFNAGLNSYYSERVVIDLDGAVDGAALEAIRERALLEYMRDMRVAYVADYAASIHQIYAPFYGHAPALELVHVVDREGVSWHGSAIHIYRLLD